MCANCGCNDNNATLLNLQTGARKMVGGEPEPRSAHAHSHEPEHEHEHAHGHHHHHEHDHAHAHEHGIGGHAYGHDHPPDHEHHHGNEHHHSSPDQPRTHTLDLESRILAKNDALAAKTRAWMSGREILALNLVSSPGSGKTTLLERTIIDLAGELDLFVIEGDQATANDGARIRKAGAPVVQVNTGSGCHLDAAMVEHGLAELKPGLGAIVLIENVGNLVCPALFDLGERAKVVIFSVTEGEDKPLKYPHMFRAAGLVVLNKIDLLPHLDFALDEALQNVRCVNPGAPVLTVSARTGEGLPQWYEWLRNQAKASREFALA